MPRSRPILYNQTGEPALQRTRARELGVAIVILPGVALRATIQAVHDLGVALRDTGPLAEEAFAARFKDHPLANVHAFAGFDQIQAWERAFLPAEDQDKYENSVGYQPTR